MGSPNGLWTAVSGGMAQSQNLDIIANNLANVNTVGFKKDAPVFKEYLTAAERAPTTIDIPRTAFKDSDFYHHEGREDVKVTLDRVHTDHTQGSLKPTGAAFDLAIDGPGFFAVQAPSGMAFSRAGNFKVNGEGLLVTNDGYPVLGFSPEAAAALGPQGTAATRDPAALNPFSLAPAAQPLTPGTAAQPVLAPISLRQEIQGGKKLHITPEGQIYSGDAHIATLAVAEFTDSGRLSKTVSTLYQNNDPANVVRVAGSSRVHQGFLESSNVNPVSELVELLKANRMYEGNMRAIKAYGEMATKEANEVGKL